MARKTAPAPTPEQAARLRAKLVADARDHADRDRRPQFQKAVAELLALPNAEPDHAREIAALLARGGELAKALRMVEPLADPSVAARVLAHAVDRAVRLRSKDGLPPDLHAGFDAVLSAFAFYESGNDDAARTALEPIGLRSPFLEWKVLLRGLLAYSAGDDAKASENWQRLDGDRVPARLAAPLRARVDSAFLAALPGDAAGALARQYRSFGSHPLVEPLERVRAELGRDRPLVGAFRQVEAALPLIRQHCTVEMQARLARAFYRAILDHGDPDDLPKYRRQFGPPPDDPEFHRLQALALEQSGNWDGANKFWSAYESWLDRNPRKWPADVARRGRAMILHRMGRNADLQTADAEDGLEAFDLFLGPPKANRKRRPPADPTPLFRRAADLAPDWPEPARELVNRLAGSRQFAEAESVSRRLLEHTPTAAGSLDSLAAAYLRAGRAADALALRTKALAANPLDKLTRLRAAYAHLAAVRRTLIDAGPADAEAALAPARSVCEAETPVGFHALRSVIEQKFGRKAEVDAARDAALVFPGGRLMALLFLAVDGGLAKLKPADKRPADQALTAAWAGPADPREVNLLYAGWDQYHLEGIAYRGQSSQEKKIHALYLTACSGNGPEEDFEPFADGLALRHQWALCLKVAAKLRDRFPANPLFPLLIAEAEYEKSGRPGRKVAVPLRKARELAEASREPRHRALLERIGQLEAEACPRDLFDFFFDRR